MSPTERKILELLEVEEMYGLQMVAADEGLKKGSIYVLLGRLEKKKFIIPRQEGPTRRYYRIEDRGRLALIHVRQFWPGL